MIGTLAVYYREPRSPTSWERAILERGAALAGIAVEQRTARRIARLHQPQRQRRDLPDRSARGLVYVNDAFARMFGYATPTEILTAGQLELYVDPARRLQLLGMLDQHGRCQNEEVQFRRRDGTRFWGLMTRRGGTG